MRRTISSAVLGLTLLLAGCGGAGEGPTGDVRFDDLAARVGCASVDKYTDMFTHEAGDCILTDGTKIGLAGFKDRATRNAWALMVRGGGYTVETGEHWAVTGEDADAVRAAARVIRG